MKKTNRAVVAHEAVRRMGFGAEVAAMLQEKAFDWLDAPIERVGARFAPLAVRARDGAVRRPPGRRRARGDPEDRRRGLMANEVKLPRLGQGMESGTIVKWLKAEGERVEKGEPLFEVDTDKATQEVEAEASGVLLAIAVAAGEVPVGQTVALIGEPGESVPTSSLPRRRQPGSPAPPEAPRRPAGEPETSFRAAINGARDKTTGRVKASPLARRMARDRGVELGRAHGYRARRPDRRRGRRAGRSAASRLRRPQRPHAGRRRPASRRSRASSSRCR